MYMSIHIENARKLHFPTVHISSLAEDNSMLVEMFGNYQSSLGYSVKFRNRDHYIAIET